MRAAAYIFGWMLMLLAFGHLFPLMVAIRFQEITAIVGFLESFLLIGFMSGILLFSFKGFHANYDRQTCLRVLLLFTVFTPFFAGLPFWMSGSLDTAIKSYFEATSALTTTGASVLGSQDSLPRAILVWRILVEWFGGLIFLVVATCLFPLIGIAAFHHATNALPHGDGEALIDRLRGALQMLGQTYASITALFALLLWITGLPFLDGITLAMTAMASGGFTLSEAGLAGYQNIWAELIILTALVTSVLNITLIRSAARGKVQPIWQDPEHRTFLKTVAYGVTLTIFFYAIATIGQSDALLTLWEQIFTAISVLTTSGLTNTEHGVPLPVGVIFISLAILGGTIMSTSGGIKMLRLHLLSQFAGRELSRLAHPHGVFPVYLRMNKVQMQDMRSVWGLVLSLIAVIAIGSLALAANQTSFWQAISVSVSMLTSTGPLPYLVDPSFTGYGGYSALSLLFSIILMIAGRLEVLLLLLPFVQLPSLFSQYFRK